MIGEKTLACIALFLLAIVWLFGSGCASTPEIKPIPAVAASCPQPPQIVKPVLTISQLKQADLKTLSSKERTEKVIRAYTLTVGELISFSDYLVGIINGYRERK